MRPDPAEQVDLGGLSASLKAHRIVSLVPSLTESLFELGLGARLVGVTDYCVHPADQVQALPRVGGTKKPVLAAILNLAPDLVLANQEENPKELVSVLRQQGIPVWVTYPRTVKEAIQVLWQLVELNPDPFVVARLRVLEMTYEWTFDAASQKPPRRVFCPVWQTGERAGQQWWMSIGHDTYAHDLLLQLGGANVFADRTRDYDELFPSGEVHPEQLPRRYPKVTQDDIIAAQPELILLPTEPYPYTEADCPKMVNLFAETPAGRSGRVVCVDGSLLFWHGTRLARALRELPEILTE